MLRAIGNQTAYNFHTSENHLKKEDNKKFPTGQHFLI